MPSISDQLEKVKTPLDYNYSITTKRVKSLVFKNPSTISYVECFALCNKNFKLLCEKDPFFSKYSESLFSETSINLQILNLDRATYDEINSQIEEFFCHISCHLDQDYSHYCIEWLIWKYRVDLNLPKSLILSVVPYLETGLLPKFAQLIDLKKVDKSFSWLQPYAISGCSINRKNILKLITKNKTFAHFICDCIIQFFKYCTQPESLKDISNFFLSISIEITEQKNEINTQKQFISIFQSVILQGLKSTRLVRSSIYLVILRFSSNLKIEKLVVESWLKEMLKVRDDGLEWETMQTAYNLMLQQDISTLSEKLTRRKDSLIAKMQPNQAMLITAQFDNLVIPEPVVQTETCVKMELDEATQVEEVKGNNSATVSSERKTSVIIPGLKKTKKRIKKLSPIEYYGEKWITFSKDKSNPKEIAHVISDMARSKFSPQLSALLEEMNESLAPSYIISIALRILEKALGDGELDTRLSEHFLPLMLALLVDPSMDETVRENALSICLKAGPDDEIIPWKELEEKEAVAMALAEQPLMDCFSLVPKFFVSTLNVLMQLHPKEHYYSWSMGLNLFKEKVMQHILRVIDSKTDPLVKIWRRMLLMIANLFSNHSEETIKSDVIVLAELEKRFFNQHILGEKNCSEKLKKCKEMFLISFLESFILLIGNLSVIFQSKSEITVKAKKRIVKRLGGNFKPFHLINNLKMDYTQFAMSLEISYNVDKICPNAMKNIEESNVLVSRKLSAASSVISSYLSSNTLLYEEFSKQISKLVDEKPSRRSSLTSLDVLVKKSETKSIEDVKKMKLKNNHEEIVLARLNLLSNLAMSSLKPLCMHLLDAIDGFHKEVIVSEAVEEDDNLLDSSDSECETNKTTKPLLPLLNQRAINNKEFNEKSALQIIEFFNHLLSNVENIRESLIEQVISTHRRTSSIKSTIRKRFNERLTNKELIASVNAVLDPIFLSIEIFSSNSTFHQRILDCLISAANIFPVVLCERLLSMIKWLTSANSKEGKLVLFRFDNEHSILTLAKLISVSLPCLLENSANASTLGINCVQLFTSGFLKTITNQDHLMEKVKIFTGLIHSLAQVAMPFSRMSEICRKINPLEVVSFSSRKTQWLWVLLSMMLSESEESFSELPFFPILLNEFPQEIQISNILMQIKFFIQFLLQANSENFPTSPPAKKGAKKKSKLLPIQNKVVVHPDDKMPLHEVVDIINFTFTTTAKSIQTERVTGKKRSLSESADKFDDDVALWSRIEKTMTLYNKVYSTSGHDDLKNLLFRQSVVQEDVTHYSDLMQNLINFSLVCMSFSTEEFRTPLQIVEINYNIMNSIQDSLPNHVYSKFLIDIFNHEETYMCKKAISLCHGYTNRLVRSSNRSKEQKAEIERLNPDLKEILGIIYNLVFVSKKISLGDASCAKHVVATFRNILQLIEEKDCLVDIISSIMNSPVSWWPEETEGETNGIVYAESRSMLCDILQDGLKKDLLKDCWNDIFISITAFSIDHVMTSLRLFNMPKCTCLYSSVAGITSGTVLNRENHALKGLELINHILEYIYHLGVGKKATKYDTLHFDPHHLPHLTEEGLKEDSKNSHLSGYLIWLICKLFQCDLQKACGTKAQDRGEVFTRFKQVLIDISQKIFNLPNTGDLLITLYILMKYSSKTHDFPLIIGCRRMLGNFNTVPVLSYYPNLDVSLVQYQKQLMDTGGKSLVVSLIHLVSDVPNWIVERLLLAEKQFDENSFLILNDEGINAAAKVLLTIQSKDARLSLLSNLLSWSLDMDTNRDPSECIPSIGGVMCRLKNFFTLCIRLSGMLEADHFLDIIKRLSLVDYLTSIVNLFHEATSKASINRLEVRQINSVVKKVKPCHLVSLFDKSLLIGSSCLRETIHLLQIIFSVDLNSSDCYSLSMSETTPALPEALVGCLDIAKEHDNNEPLLAHNEIEGVFIAFAEFIKFDEAIMKPLMSLLCQRLTAVGKNSAHWSTRKTIILIIRNLLKASFGLDKLDSNQVMKFEEERSQESISFSKKICEEVLRALSHVMEDDRIEVEAEASRLNTDLQSAIRTINI